jgi:hypothetical protein
MMPKRLLLIALMMVSLATAAGCASEDDGCTGDDCVADPIGSSGGALPSETLCHDRCQGFEGCGSFSQDTCTHACLAGAFAPGELECLGVVACGAEGECLEHLP